MRRNVEGGGSNNDSSVSHAMHQIGAAVAHALANVSAHDKTWKNPHTQAGGHAPVHHLTPRQHRAVQHGKRPRNTSRKRVDNAKLLATYAPILGRRGFFRDVNGGVGYSNGRGGIETGVHGLGMQNMMLLAGGGRAARADTLGGVFGSPEPVEAPVIPSLRQSGFDAPPPRTVADVLRSIGASGVRGHKIQQQAYKDNWKSTSKGMHDITGQVLATILTDPDTSPAFNPWTGPHYQVAKDILGAEVPSWL